MEIEEYKNHQFTLTDEQLNHLWELERAKDHNLAPIQNNKVSSYRFAIVAILIFFFLFIMGESLNNTTKVELQSIKSMENVATSYSHYNNAKW